MADLLETIDKVEVKKLLDYTNEHEKIFAAAAENNVKKLSKLGLNSEDIEEVIRNTEIDELISTAQKNGMVDVLLSNSSVLPIVSKSVLQMLNEKSLKKEINRNISAVMHRVVEIQEFHSVLNREIEVLKKEKLTVEDDLQGKDDLNSKFKESEIELDQYERESKIPQNANLNGILDKIRKLDENVMKISNKIENVKQRLECYCDLPPDILIAKGKLTEAEFKCKQMNNKINETLSKKLTD